jgi:hypothetical protein
MVFAALFLFTLALFITVHELFIDPPRRGKYISRMHAGVVILSLVYVITLPIYTVAWLISTLF